jgi:large subunit ribosomal protein L21
MYAIIQTGGKQYRVAPGDVIEIEKLPLEAGNEVSFAEVLMVAGDKEIEVGQPTIENAKVTGEVVEQFRGPKVLTFKHKKRKNYRKTIGHRQDLTRVKIKDIVAG